MRVRKTNDSLAQASVDAVVVGAFAGERPGDRSALPALAQADQATGGLITKLIEREEISGKKLELTTLLSPPGLSAGQLLVVGLGEREKFNCGIAFRAAAAAAKQLSGKKSRQSRLFLGRHEGGSD